MKRHGAQRGFTLIELCVALALVGMIASASYAGICAEQRHYRELQDEREATRIASACLERARAGAFDERFRSAQRFRWQDVRCERLGQVQVWLEKRRIDADLDEVIVRVRWRTPGATEPRERSLTTWIGRIA